MDKQELAYLIKNYFQDTLQPEEEHRLMEALENPSEELLEYFDVYYRKYASEVVFPLTQKQRIWEEIVKNQPKEAPSYSWKPYLKYAAVLVCVVLGAIIYNTRFSVDTRLESPDISETTPIYLKTHTGPLLAVSDREEITSPLAADEWYRYGISMNSDQALIIAHVPDPEKQRGRRLKISAEQGQIQQVLLPDGSKVWLNSNAELDLPLAFASDLREVQLVGEAYFEVASQASRPFRVITAYNTTEVLGTQFNVIAQPGKLVETTLIEGSVRVFNDSKSVLLHPGEQAFGNEKLDKRKADIEKATAWKQGDFYFDDISIKDLMDVVDEWYDIAFVTYEYESVDRFSGTFKRTSSLQELLSNLEEVSSIRFNIKEGGVYVLKK
ncbi:FecR family protein [Sphingobacterium chuzhouense]|uniref:FecR domain-containing protein n=1 Tax=Sphingobacterium chuzhouense TaxID=1742264 RepID=A0ABR7XP54_9SPHI|nr:FecR family protein [Sphingobacterium chuzhouense]MBD1420950.1 FecR domain-containing protein [Sphingobacterium chuzhouense]